MEVASPSQRGVASAQVWLDHHWGAHGSQLTSVGALQSVQGPEKAARQPEKESRESGAQG